MNILITGENGFLAREFKEYFSKGYKVSCLGRNSLNLTDEKAVDSFFSLNGYVDVIIHTAVEGGKRNDNDTFNSMSKNICMFSNLIKHRSKYGKLFCFGSGAEYDRRTNIKDVKEGDFIHHHPDDFYGFAKNNIAREILKQDDNVFNFRLFGCFGKYEDDARFVKRTVKRISEENSIVIHRDMFMDFFYVGDLCAVIDFYIKEKPVWDAYSKYVLPKEINMVYKEKTRLSHVASVIKEVSESKAFINVEHMGDLRYYTGDGSTLSSLGIPLKGLTHGIQEMWKCLK